MRCLLVLLCVSLVGCGSAQTRSVRIDPALALLVPADTILLAGIRMEDLRATPFYKKSVGQRSLPVLDSLAKETGLDPRKDIWELLFASDGTKTAILARGQFSSQGLEPRLERQGATRAPYKGYTLIGNEQGAVVFMNATTAVAGRPATVRAIIDQRGRSTGLPPALKQKISAIPAGNQVWLVANGGFGELAKAAPNAGNLANLARIMSMLENVTAAADFRAGLSMFATGVCRSDQDARSLGDALRGLVGLARLSTPSNDPDMLRVYDGIQVAQQQRTVRVDVKLSQELLDKALAKLPQR